MDYLSYVQETIDMEGRRQVQAPKVEGLLEEICISFLASYKDRPRALASSPACSGSKKSVAIEICNLLRRAVKQDALLCFKWLCKEAQAKVDCSTDGHRVLQNLQLTRFIVRKIGVQCLLILALHISFSTLAWLQIERPEAV